MVIVNAQLPYKAGYVEVEIDGIRQHQKIETEETMEQDETNLDLMSMVVDYEYRITLLELGVM